MYVTRSVHIKALWWFHKCGKKYRCKAELKNLVYLVQIQIVQYKSIQYKSIKLRQFCHLTHCGLVTPYGDFDLGQY